MPYIPHPIKQWDRGKELGRGKYGTVYLGINKENMKLFAIKSAHKNDNEKKQALFNERKALTACHSKYIVQYLGSATSNNLKDSDSSTTLDLFLEFVPKGSVLDQLHHTRGAGLSERLVAAYTRDVLRGLSHLHDCGIVHGDIRCANFLVGGGNIKLCDLGSAKFLGKDNSAKSSEESFHIVMTGTEGWMAPEVMIDKAQQDTPADIYSLGCSIVEMCTGNPPHKEPMIYSFRGPRAKEIDNFAFPHTTVDIPPNYSQLCRDFAHSCLAQNPANRPSAKTLLDHSWIVNAPPYPGEAKVLPSPGVTKPSNSFKSMLGCRPSMI